MNEKADSRLVAEFHRAMRDIYARAKKEAGYNATRFLQMVDKRGGLETARFLLDAKAHEVSEGFTQLALRGRLDLTVEFLVQKDPWRQLFSYDQLKTAERRLGNNKRDP